MQDSYLSSSATDANNISFWAKKKGAGSKTQRVKALSDCRGCFRRQELNVITELWEVSNVSTPQLL